MPKKNKDRKKQQRDQKQQRQDHGNRNNDTGAPEPGQEGEQEEIDEYSLQAQELQDGYSQYNQVKCGHLELFGLDVCRKLGKTLNFQCKSCSTPSSNKAKGKKNQRAEKPRNQEDMRICLMCAGCFCYGGFDDHVKDHYATNKKHCLVVQPKTWKCWCLACDEPLPLDNPLLSDVLGCVNALQGIEEKRKEDTSKVDRENVQPDPGYNKNQQAAQSQTHNAKQNKNKKGNQVLIPGLKGLQNLGNTCFFNSVVQCLSQTTSLLHYFVPAHFGIPKSEIRQFEGPTKKALRGVIEDIWLSDSRVVTPKPLLVEISKKAPRFKGGQQQDSQELLRYLLDGLIGEEKKVIEKLLDVRDHYLKTDSTDVAEEKKKQEVLDASEGLSKNSTTFTERIFQGKLISILTCHHCNNQKIKEETFLDLSLPIPVSLLSQKEKQSFSAPPPKPPPVKQKEKKKGNNGKMSKKQEKRNKKVLKEQNQTNNEQKENGQGAKGQAKENVKGAETAKKGLPQSGGVHKVVKGEPSQTLKSDGAGGGENEDGEGENVEPVTENVEGETGENVEGETAEGETGENVEGETVEGENVEGETEGENVEPVTENVEGETGENVEGEGETGEGEGETVEGEGEPGEGETVEGEGETGEGEKETENVDGENVEGETAEGETVEGEGETVDGENVEDETVEGENVDGENVDGENVEGETVEGEGETVDGENVEGENAEGVEGQNVDGETVEGENVDGENVDGDENANGETENIEEGEGEDAEGDAEDGETNEGEEESELNPEDADIMPKILEIIKQSEQSDDNDTIPPIATNSDYSAPKAGIYSCLQNFTNVDILTNDNAVQCYSCTRDVFELNSLPLKLLQQDYPEEEEEWRKKNKLDLLPAQDRDPLKKHKIPLVKRPSSKQFLILEPPETLTIHLKRFYVTNRGTGIKINTWIEFPVEIDITPYVKPTPAPNSYIYSLYGVCCHSGGLNGGHYIAYTKLKYSDGSRGDWYYISDSNCHQVTLSEVLKSSAYLLFYEKISQ